MSFRRTEEEAHKHPSTTEARRVYGPPLARRELPTPRTTLPCSSPSITSSAYVSVVDNVFKDMGIVTGPYLKRRLASDDHLNLANADYFNLDEIVSVSHFDKNTFQPQQADPLKYALRKPYRKFLLQELNAKLTCGKSTIGKFAGKNGLGEPLLAKAKGWTQQAVKHFVQEASKAYRTNYETQPVIISEGDNYEENAPFSTAPSHAIKELDTGTIPSVMIFVKNKADTYSKNFVEGWLAQIGTWRHCTVYFVEVTPNDSSVPAPMERKSLITFNADWVYFIAQTSTTEHMEKRDTADNTIYTAGYKHLRMLNGRKPDPIHLSRFPQVTVLGHRAGFETPFPAIRNNQLQACDYRSLQFNSAHPELGFSYVNLQ